MTNEQVIDKVKKLFAMANHDGSDVNEAKTALLQAQKLMAKYNIHMDAMTETEELQCVSMQAETNGNKKFRFQLGAILAKNFRCKCYCETEYNHGKKHHHITFFGTKDDVLICKEAFEYAYRFAYKEGMKAYRTEKEVHGTGNGVFNSYTMGFCAGIKEALDRQCVALMIVMPKEVNDAYAEKSKDFTTMRRRLSTRHMNSTAYNAGMIDGKTVLNGRRLAAES